MAKKAIICSGCSFTWGQGLWYYAETDKYIPINQEYIRNTHPIPEEGEIFKEANRWPRKVAKYFNLIEYVKPYNGGTDEESINFINYVLDENPNRKYDNHFGTNQVKVENCEWIIFQTTQTFRTPFYFEHNGKSYKLASSPNLKNLESLELKLDSDEYYPYKNVSSFIPFYDWLYDNNYSLEDFEVFHKQGIIDTLENTLKSYESRGVKIGLISWTDEYDSIIETNSYLKSKKIMLEYNGINYKNIEEMMLKNDERLTIIYDSRVLHDPGDDHHPSKECHDVIARNVIEYIRNYE